MAIVLQAIARVASVAQRRTGELAAERAAEDDRQLALNQEAAELQASGLLYLEIGRRQGCHPTTANRRALAWRREVAKLEDLEERRQALSTRQDYIFAQMARELEVLRSARVVSRLPERPKELVVTLERRIGLACDILSRMVEANRHHAELFGVAGGDRTSILNLGPGAGGLNLTKIDVPDDPQAQEQLADALDEVDRILGGALP